MTEDESVPVQLWKAGVRLAGIFHAALGGETAGVPGVETTSSARATRTPATGASLLPLHPMGTSCKFTTSLDPNNVYNNGATNDRDNLPKKAKRQVNASSSIDKC